MAAAPSADRNAQGRVMAWKKSLVFYTHNAAGTWGEPQYRFGQYMDNDYVRVLLQGSPVYLLTLLLALGAAIWSLPKMGNWGRLLALGSTALAINAMSANPLNYSATALLWMVLGYYLMLRQKQALGAAEDTAGGSELVFANASGWRTA